MKIVNKVLFLLKSLLKANQKVSFATKKLKFFFTEIEDHLKSQNNFVLTHFC